MFKKEILGTFIGLTLSNPRKITTQLKIVNKKDINQNDLDNKSISLFFNIKEESFTCTVVD